MAGSNFVDYVKIFARSGHGGAGSAHFRREKFVAFGGPDGGDGGKGGDVYFVGDRHKTSLIDFMYKRKYLAENGEKGERRNCHGRNGEDLYISVPLGTVITDKETGEFIAEYLKKPKEKEAQIKNEAKKKK